MNSSDKTPNSTADWRKYPKGPNFLGIVIGSSVLLLVLLAAAWVLLKGDARHLLPHGTTATPNSMVQPPAPALERSAAA